ncbi:MAG TPA: hypothetical protein VHB98_09965 [Chloroflexota bacterium]|nr:hypothetical protein [Chloroflexota bacterium]
MADVEDSFNTTGPTVVAFETLNTAGIPAFGVSAAGSTCGVYGQGASVAHDRRTSPSLTGVLGRGDFHGVYGITSQVSDADTPDFGADPAPPGIGVVGVNDGASPAVLGNNGIVGAALASSTAMTDLTLQQIGIAGVNLSGPGIVGISFSGDATADLNVHDTLLGREFHDGTNAADAGVEGLSARGPGIRGVSRHDRGGVFQSATAGDGIVAQLRLFPAGPALLVPGEAPQPPADAGEAGDLLALTYIDGNRRTRASLWFCIEGVSTYGTAVWQRVV